MPTRTYVPRILLAVSFALLAMLSIGLPDFGSVWPIIPKGFLWHDTIATLAGVILLASAIALGIPRSAKPGSLVLASILLLRALLLSVPRAIAHPFVEASWYDVSENLTHVAGAWTVFAMLPQEIGASSNLRIGQILFALALPAIGLSHMVYLDQTAPIIPAWIPFHVPLAYLTGVAHIAAGVGILFGVLPRLAATLEAVMVSLFTLLVWVPTVIGAPTNLFNWAEICVSTAITGSAWAVAESFRNRPWT